LDPLIAEISPTNPHKAGSNRRNRQGHPAGDSATPQRLPQVHEIHNFPAILATCTLAGVLETISCSFIQKFRVVRIPLIVLAWILASRSYNDIAHNINRCAIHETFRLVKRIPVTVETCACMLGVQAMQNSKSFKFTYFLGVSS